MDFILLPGITDIPLWVKSETTIADLLSRAAQIQHRTDDTPDLDQVLSDSEYLPLLSQRVFQSGLLEDKLLNIFNPARLLLVVISFAGQVYRFRMPAAATVRDVKQQIKGLLPSERRKAVSFELRLTGSNDRPTGTARLLSLTRLPFQNVCLNVASKDIADSNASRILTFNETVFRKHLRQDRFQLGIDQGRWRLVSINWPRVVVGVNIPDRVKEDFVRFRLDDYPANPPGIEFWDEENCLTIPPDRWPAWFKHFIAESYPTLVTVDPAPYSPELLQLSLFMAKRKHGSSNNWSALEDITQCLSPMTEYLSLSIRRKGPNVQRRRIRRVVRPTTIHRKPADDSWLTLEGAPDCVSGSNGQRVN